jgi:hypothetical protein
MGDVYHQIAQVCGSAANLRILQTLAREASPVPLQVVRAGAQFDPPSTSRRLRTLCDLDAVRCVGANQAARYYLHKESPLGRFACAVAEYLARQAAKER